MFKSRLQEFCQSRSWTLPTYGTTRDGPDHCPQFKAVVEVNGQAFLSPDCCKNAKEAQNLAAKIALEHLSGDPNSNINTLATQVGLSVIYPDGQNSPQTIPPGCHAQSTMGNKRPRTNNASADGLHIYKNLLQNYAQKRNLDLPEYSAVREGPPHAARFKSSVTLGGVRYECLEFCHTLKEAESAAAKVALTSLFPGGVPEDDTLVYKSLLQELALREFACWPTYTSQSMGASHMPVFVSTVEIKGETFEGQQNKTKKLAEMSAARVAYMALKERGRKQGGGDQTMKSAVEDAHKFSSSADRSRDDTNISNQHISTDVKPGLNERFEIGKDGKYDQPTTTPGVTKQTGPSTVVTSTGMSINLDSEVAEDGSEEQKIVVIPNGPDVQIPPGVIVLEKNEKHIVMTRCKALQERSLVDEGVGE